MSTNGIRNKNHDRKKQTNRYIRDTPENKIRKNTLFLNHRSGRPISENPESPCWKITVVTSVNRTHTEKIADKIEAIYGMAENGRFYRQNEIARTVPDRVPGARPLRHLVRILDLRARRHILKGVKSAKKIER